MSFQKITTALARQLVLNYRNLKLGRRLKMDDTQAIWFSREVLLEALNIINPEPNLTVSGIRFYMGAYEENEHQPDIVKKGKLTLVIVQTTEEIQGAVKVQRDILENPTAQAGYPTQSPNDPIEFNDGQLCPPPGCDEKGLLNFP